MDSNSVFPEWLLKVNHSSFLSIRCELTSDKPGLAQTAVHGIVGSPLVHAHRFRNSNGATKANSTSSVLSILSRVVADPEIILNSPPDLFNMYKDVIEKHGSRITAHLDAWTPNLSTEEGLNKTVEEVMFLICLIYAVPGLVSEKEGSFNADFFT